MTPEEAIEALEEIRKKLMADEPTEAIRAACTRILDAQFWLREHLEKWTISDEQFQRFILWRVNAAGKNRFSLHTD